MGVAPGTARRMLTTPRGVMAALIDIVRRTGLAALVATHNLEL